MNYLSIQTLAEVFQGTASLLPLLMIAWAELSYTFALFVVDVSFRY